MTKFRLVVILALAMTMLISINVAHAQTAATVAVSQDAELGSILTDSSGNTLYLFTNDERNVSNCTEGCAGAWPPLITVGDPVADEGVNADKLDVYTRDDGSDQVTYNGWPLYYYVSDTNPGDTKGQAVPNWWVVSTFGGPIQTEATVSISENAELGTMLVEASGRSLYLLTNDERNVSKCSGGCALAWPPLLTVGDPVAGEGVNADRLRTTTRDDDGSTQVTYNGWPLYYFANDASPGDTNGQVVPNWWVVSTFGGPIQTEAAVNVAEHADLGEILVDQSGRSLYLLTNDEADTSSCTGGCALTWPPLLTVGDPAAGDGASADLLRTTTRDDGSVQVTYNGAPLYFFADDDKPGDANGQDVGNVWFVVQSSGDAVQPATEPETPSVGDTTIPSLARAGLIASIVLLLSGGFLLVRRRRSYSPG